MDLSNPVRSPRFRSSVSEMAQQTAFAFGVLLDIYGYYPYTENSICLCHSLDKQYQTLSLG
jgi:hypothetical protein